MKRILLAVLLLATACAAPAPTTDETLAAPVGTSTAMPVETATTAPGPTATILPVEAPMQPAFARYDLQPVNVSPSLRQEPVDPSFGNVLVPLVLSPEQLQRLVADGVISPDSTVVAILTSDGLKDPDTTAAHLAPIPSSGTDLDSVVQILRDVYGHSDPLMSN